MKKGKSINWSRMVGETFNNNLAKGLMFNLSLKSTNDFLMGVVNCLMEILDLDIGGWLIKEGENVRIGCLIDEDNRLNDETMQDDKTFDRRNTPKYLSKVWEINAVVVSDPTPYIGIDLWIKLSDKVIIFLDGSSEEISLPNIMEQLMQNAGKLSRMFIELYNLENKIEAKKGEENG